MASAGGPPPFKNHYYQRVGYLLWMEACVNSPLSIRSFYSVISINFAVNNADGLDLNTTSALAVG